MPSMDKQDVLYALKSAGIGAILAACFGIVHDACTFQISAEYFTKLKFQQFDFLPDSWPVWLKVASIGFLATWWVGGIIGWFIARRFTNASQLSQLAPAFALVGLCAAAGSGIGYLYGIWRGPDANYDLWAYTVLKHSIHDSYAFIRTAYIHNASYLGCIIGFDMLCFANDRAGQSLFQILSR